MFQNPDKDCKVSDDMVKHKRLRQRFRASIELDPITYNRPKFYNRQP